MKKLFAFVIVLALAALALTPNSVRSHAQLKEPQAKLRRHAKPIAGQYRRPIYRRAR